MSTDDLIEAFLVHLRECSCTDRTLDTYRERLTLADRGLPFGLDIATEDELRAWLWRDGYAPASRALTYAAFVGFFRWALDRGHLDFDPTTEIPRPKVREGVPRVASDEAAKWAVTESAEPYRLWAQLAAYAGLRCIEIYRLDRDHITKDFITAHGKGNKPRSIPTHPLIWAAVQGLPPGPLTDMPNERRLSNRFGRYCTDHFGKLLTLHRLRGWFATAAYNATKDPRTLSTVLGHANMATTARYIAAAEPQRRALVIALPVFDDAPDVTPSPPALGASPSPLPGGAPDPPADGPAGPPPPPEPRLGG